MDLIESVKYNSVDDHGWTKVASRKRGRKQKSADPATNKNLAYSDHKFVLGSLEEQAAGDVKDESSNLKAEETELKPDHWEVSLAKAEAKIGPSDLAEFIVREPDSYPSGAMFRLSTFMDYYEIVALPEVPCPWHEMFKESDLPNLFHMLHVPLSYIHELVYQTSVDWLDQQVANTEILVGFILWSFNYILCDMFLQRGGVFADDLPPGVSSPFDSCKSEVSIIVTLAMIVRSKPHLFTRVLPHLWSHHAFRGRARILLTIWLITQASQDHFHVGFYSWARNLLPLVPTSNPQSRDAILRLVEFFLAKPDAETILVNAPVWEGKRLIPPHSFKILLHLTFPNTSTREEATSRFQAIYPLLKKVALASTSGSEAIKQIFTISVRLAGERENPVLTKEATTIAIWSLTKIVDCWKHWENIYEQNLRGVLLLLKSL